MYLLVNLLTANLYLFLYQSISSFNVFMLICFGVEPTMVALAPQGSIYFLTTAVFCFFSGRLVGLLSSTLLLTAWGGRGIAQNLYSSYELTCSGYVAHKVAFPRVFFIEA